MADDADLVVAVGQGPEVGRSAGHVTHDLLVRHSTLSPDFRRGVVVGNAVAHPGVQVRANGVVSHNGEPANVLPRLAVIARQVVDNDDPTPRRTVQWTGQVALDQLPASSWQANGLGDHGVIHFSSSHSHSTSIVACGNHSG